MVKKQKKDHRKTGYIYVWTGIGAGKSTSAFGTALRMAGHRKKVVIIQFMKGRKHIGEYMVKDMLKPYYEIYQFGREGWINMEHPSQQDKDIAHKGLDFVEKILAGKKPALLVLDEVNLACAIGLIDTKALLALLDKVPKDTTVYCTGRYAPKELCDRADFITEFVPLKRPTRIFAREGIEY